MTHRFIFILIWINQLNICHLQDVFRVPVPQLNENSQKFIEYQRTNLGCERLRSNREECKFYGECCGDPVRIRERLEPDTYHCMNIGNTQGKRLIQKKKVNPCQNAFLLVLRAQNKERILPSSDTVYCSICSPQIYVSQPVKARQRWQLFHRLNKHQ